MSIMATRPRAGRYEDEEQQDNDLGPMPDETEQYHRLVRQLVADGDHRARSAGRHARRTLAEMAPGYEQQPVLRLTGPLTFQSADDACPICTFWKCIRGFPSVSTVRQAVAR
ncbi:hypothetical protein ACGF8B_39470 [Streptomyces sp. NPDC047917]|uniref:hypothetical protein n=1 Tax=Streptomyces sp. NPDC047917 TaxID=3365491 RepID=UPI0037170363